MPTDAISKANDILDIDETDTVINRRQIPSDQDIEKMSAGIYIIDTPWLIEQMEKEAQKKNLKSYVFYFVS